MNFEANTRFPTVSWKKMTSEIQKDEAKNFEEQSSSNSTNRPENLGIQKQRILAGRRYLDTSEESDGAVAVAEAPEPTTSAPAPETDRSISNDQMVSFVAEDIQERLRKCSVAQSNDSAASSSTSIQSVPSPYPPLLPDPKVLDDLENQAKQIALQVDRILLEFKGCLSGMTELTVECVNTYSESIKKTCDSVDGSIKSMYQLMAKVEELLVVVKNLPPLAKQVLLATTTLANIYWHEISIHWRKNYWNGDQLDHLMASKSLVEGATKTVVRQVKPIYSSSHQDAHRRVLTAWKGWLKHFPTFIYRYKLPYTDAEIKYALKRQFLKNAHVTDVRVIDRLVHISEQELKGVEQTWTPSWTVRNVLWGEQIEPKPKDFLSKFLAGKD